MKYIDTPIVFVVCNDYGELALAMYLLEQQSFAQNVTLMLPPQLYAKNADVLPGRTLVYHSLHDVQAQMTGRTGGILGLFSGYLLPNHRLCDLDQLGAFLQWAGDNGWNNFTSDPFLGLLDSVDPADLVTLKAPAWNIIWYLAAKNEKKRLSQLLTDTHALVGEMLHVYPVGDTPHEIDQGFDKRLHLHNDALASLSETQAKVTDEPSRWLFVLGDQDYTVQLGKYGRFSRRFPNLLMEKLHETLEAGRLPTLVAPSKVIELVRKRSPAADSIELLSHCDYRTFQSLLTDAEYVFYWNAVSFTCIQRTLIDKPWFTFDVGHLLRGMNTDYNSRITQWFYREARPPHLDIRDELTKESLLKARQDYLKSARLIRNGLLSTHDPVSLLEAWQPLARKTVTQIFDIVIELGRVVSAAQLDGNTVVDESLLTHPKSVVEAAVTNLLKRDIGDQAEFVRTSAMTLAFFQPGVGEGGQTLDSPGPNGKSWRETVQAELDQIENVLLLSPEEAAARARAREQEQEGVRAHAQAQAAAQAQAQEAVAENFNIVIELGQVVSAAQLDGNSVLDEGLLAHTKDDIRNAVANLLERDIGDKAEFVRSSVMTLAFFQPGVGDGRQTLDSPGPDGKPWRETVQAELQQIENDLFKPHGRKSVAQSFDIVMELGQVVSTAQLDGNSVVDEGLLAHPKSDIREAVTDLLKSDIGDEAEFVRSAVMTLAFFQPGVGDSRYTLDSPGPGGKPWRETVQTEQYEIKNSLPN